MRAFLFAAALAALGTLGTDGGARLLHSEPCTIGKAKLAAVCGTYTVYENRAAASGRTIALKFVVIKAARAAVGAIAWNPGGPGASATVDAPYIADGETATELRMLHDRYDILLLDNRGTGGSAPQGCDLAPASMPQVYFRQIWPDSLLRQCRTRLARNADLSLYTTALAADDLDDLRAALGYDKLVLDGGSYGTQFYLIYARRHPANVASMVLDGVAPPHLLIVPLEDARGAQTSVERLIAACRDDAACHQHFPSLAEHFAAVVARFDAGPVMVPLRRGSQTIEVALSKEVFADRLRQLLYSPQGAAYAPLIIEAAYRGDRAPLATMVDTVTNGLAEILALGLNLSVTCAEDIPFITAADVARTSAGSFEGDLRIRAQQRACAIWNVDPVPASYDEPVRSEAPILMISGSDDPATPPQYARDALPYLPNARILLIRNGSHGTQTPCSLGLVVAFVRAGSASGLDLTRCAGSFHRPPFATSMADFGD